MNVIAWGAKVSGTFLERVKWVVDDLEIGDDSVDGVNKLMACMAWESGRTFSAKIANKAGSGATGLIQFMPSTAVGLGTSTAKLALMSAEDQLNYVWKYFEPYKGKLKTLADLYMAILWPSAVGKPETSALWTKGGMPTTFRQNSGLDTNNDGIITKAEAAGKVQAMFVEGMKPANARDYEFGSKVVSNEPEVVMPDTVKDTNDAINVTLAPEVAQPPSIVQYDTPSTTVTTTVEPKTIGNAINHAIAGWQGNVAGIVSIAVALLLDPNFSAALGTFTTKLANGNGRFGAVIALIGAGLIAYRTKNPAPPS